MPVVHLTAKGVRSLEVIEGRRTEYRDDVQPALALRVFPSGACSWVVIYTSRAGKDRRYRIGQPDRPGMPGGMSLAAARSKAREIRALVDLGGDPQAERNARRRSSDLLTVAQLVDRYLAAARLAPTTAHEWKRLARKEIVVIGRFPAGELTRAEIREWGRRIAARAPYVANRAFEVLRAAFAWGVGEDLLTGTPFVKVPRPAPEKASQRVLTLEELRAVLLGLDQVRGAYAEAAQLLLLTLTRRSAVLEASREELDGLEGLAPLWMIPPERAGLKRRRRAQEQRPHLVPLSPQAVAIFQARLAAIPPGRSRLFPRSIARIHGDAPKAESATWSSRFVRRWRHQAEETLERPIERWTVHNLRHTAATHMREELGIGKGLIRLLLGHVRGGDRAASGIYDRAELLGKRRRALRRWATFLDQLRVRVPEKVAARFGSGRGQA